jgi:hypothetical protein
MKKLGFVGLLVAAVLMIAAFPQDSDAQMFRFQKVLYTGRVLNATSDTSLFSLRVPFTGVNDVAAAAAVAGFAYAVPDSIYIYSSVHASDSAKFEIGFLSKKAASTTANAQIAYTFTVLDTSTATDNVKVTGSLISPHTDLGGVRVKGITGNGVLTANANWVEVVAEFFYHK